ncbi:unnamed protein product [Miscanthus lutarioriparius]|uniref:Uncharacterized protein n=1 Tax=Miscanthus lutarioriparius TaxID=422564 RepID=A0A811Q3D1_9POAL|nr:unnamed protein product [Miscanthus lutarioriparius]
MASARAQEYLKENLSDVHAIIEDLVGDKGKANKAKLEMEQTFKFRPLLNTEADLMRYSEIGWVERERVRLPKGESVPEPQFNEAVVFCDFFVCGCA